MVPSLRLIGERSNRGNRAFRKKKRNPIYVNLSVSVYKDGCYEVVETENGKLTLPSYIAFDPKDGKVFFGEAAKDQLLQNRENTIFKLTRLIGLNFNEAAEQSEKEFLPFKIVDINSQPFIQVDTEQGERHLTTEQATAMIFRDLKRKAEKHLNKEVTNAVVAVPGNFNDAQRRAIIDAGTIARLKVINLINESTAAAIGSKSSTDDSTEKTENVLVFKLGSGSFDLRLMEMNETLHGNQIKVIATDGDAHLGGNDFNRRVMTEYMKLYNDRKISDDEIDMQMLNIDVEKAKCNLSHSTTDCIMYPKFFKPVKRSQFVKWNMDLFESMIEKVKNVLKVASMDKNNVDRVILVGGSTKIPKIQQLLREFFVGKEITFATKEQVALGAAKHAATLSGEADPETISLSEVTGLSLGIYVIPKCENGTYRDMDVVIPRNTTIPTEKSEIYETLHENQKSMSFKVYEGEHNEVKYNHFLDEFILTGLTLAPKGLHGIQCTMKIGIDGILKVTARDEGNQSQNGIDVDYFGKRFGKEEIDRMIKENEELVTYEE